MTSLSLSITCKAAQILDSFLGQFNLPAVAAKQLQVDLKHSLEQAHVGSIVKTDLVLPQVHNQDFRGGDREQGTLAFKVLQSDQTGQLHVHWCRKGHPAV